MGDSGSAQAQLAAVVYGATGAGIGLQNNFETYLVLTLNGEIDTLRS